MKIFNAIMLTVCAVSCGMKLMAGSWVLAIVMALCATYWFIRVVRTKKPEINAEVNISDEAKEFLKAKEIKLVVNGKEIV